MMGPLTILIEVPEDWSKDKSKDLARWLLAQDLPSGLTIQLACWTADGMALNTLHVWETT